jgi:hypothetical protein
MKGKNEFMNLFNYIYFPEYSIIDEKLNIQKPDTSIVIRPNQRKEVALVCSLTI